MKDMGWTSVRGVSIREPFKGIHVYELWTGENGAKAQFVEIEPGAVFEELVDWARVRGCRRVYWHTQASNSTARHLYDQVAEHRGFIWYQIELSRPHPL